MAAHPRDHRRPGGGRVLPGPRRGNDAEHGFHRRRLRQRPRDLRGSPGRRPGEPGAGGRQLPREEGGLAGPARQGAVPGSSRDQESRRRSRPKRTWRRPRPRCAAWWRQARANRFKLEHAIEDVNNQIANLRANVATSRAGRRPWSWRRPTSSGARSSLPSGGISKEDLDQRRQTVKVDEAAVEQALQEVYAIRVGLGLPAQPANGPRPDRGARRSRPELLRRPPGAGRPAPERGPVRLLPRPSWNATPKQAIEEFYKQDPEGNLDRIFAKLIPERTGHQAGRGQAPPGPPRPGPGRAEPPLLRHRQRDRRRGDPPQRQPRQQRPGRGKA